MRQRLRKKAWSEKELQRLDKAKEHAHKNRGSVLRFLDTYLFWLVILAAIVVNCCLGVVFLPLLLALKGFPLFLLIVLTGLCFGFLFENLISDFDELSHHHYLLIVGVVPGIAAISVIVFAEFANFLIDLFRISNVHHSSLLIGLVYGLSFVLPLAWKHGLHR